MAIVANSPLSFTGKCVTDSVDRCKGNGINRTCVCRGNGFFCLCEVSWLLNTRIWNQQATSLSSSTWCCLTETDGEGKSRQLSGEHGWQHIRASLNELSQVHSESKVWSYVAAVLSDILKSKWGLSAAELWMSLRWQLQSVQREGIGTPSSILQKDNEVRRTLTAFLALHPSPSQ